MNKMTNEEINIAIAEACGWKWNDHPDCMAKKEGWSMPEKWIMRPDGALAFRHDIPDFCNDLNETHRVWQSLTHNQKKQFEIELYRIIIGDGDYNRNDDAMLITNATALQRAKALMKTLNIE